MNKTFYNYIFASPEDLFWVWLKMYDPPENQKGVKRVIPYLSDTSDKTGIIVETDGHTIEPLMESFAKDLVCDIELQVFDELQDPEGELDKPTIRVKFEEGNKRVKGN